MQDTHDLKLIIDSGTPMVIIESYDEPRVIQLLQKLAHQTGKPLFQWSVTEGLHRSSFGLQIQNQTEHAEPEKFLEYLKNRAEGGIYAICDFHPWLEGAPKTARLVKEIAFKNQHGEITMVFISPELKLPHDLMRLSASFKLKLPSEEKIHGIIREEARKWAKKNDNSKVLTNGEALEQLVTSLTGLTEGEISRLVRTAIADDGAITEQDLPGLNRAKFQLMGKDGLLNFEYRVSGFEAIGGMENFRQWLEKRQAAFTDSSMGMDAPKGVLLLGVQGGGKSLAARAVAGQWGLPLLRLDMGSLFNKYYGETEKNLRETLQLADSLAPCILWVDEIEKGLAQESDNGGPTKRVLATLLTWMAERKSRVFLVATSNNIEQLPPELIRKGRIDELFFVDLPNTQTREKIINIHLQKRGLQVDSFNLPYLIEATEGFVGAEIEQAIVSACYRGQAEKVPVSQQMLMEEISSTSPLSLVMSEKLSALRLWAQARHIPPV